MTSATPAYNARCASPRRCRHRRVRLPQASHRDPIAGPTGWRSRQHRGTDPLPRRRARAVETRTFAAATLGSTPTPGRRDLCAKFARDAKQSPYELDVASGKTRELLSPDSWLKGRSPFRR
jgi:hypothetical protein